MQPGPQARIDEQDTPRVRQHGWSDAEGDHVGQRIHLTAKIARGVGHACDAAIQAVQHDSQADRYSGDLKVPFGAGSAVMRQHGAHERLHHRNKAQENVAGCEERGQRVGRAARPAR